MSTANQLAKLRGPRVDRAWASSIFELRPPPPPAQHLIAKYYFRICGRCGKRPCKVRFFHSTPGDSHARRVAPCHKRENAAKVHAHKIRCRPNRPLGLFCGNRFLRSNLVFVSASIESFPDLSPEEVLE